MKKGTVLICGLILLLLQVQGANRYVRSGATGNNLGGDWNNAYNQIPATLVRGDTYYIASGTYGRYDTPRLAATGTSYVYIKKATAGDHGTDTGWQASYGTGQAVFSSTGAAWFVQMSYLEVDGATGSGTGGHGIKFYSSASGPTSENNAVLSTISGITVSHLVFKHIEVAGVPGGQNRTYGFGCGYNSTPSHDFTFQYCYFREVGLWMGLGGGENVLVDHCYFKDAGGAASWCNGGSQPCHYAGITMSGKNITFRYGVFENMLGTNNTTYIEPQGHAVGIYIYGNVYKATSPDERVSQWAVLSLTSSETADDIQFYNNTVYGLHSPSGLSAGNVSGSTGIVVRNNLWQNCAVTPTFSYVNTLDHNILNTGGVSFVNAAGGDFHLAGATAAGATLAGPYNLDPDGSPRGADGVWDLGAYEFTPTHISFSIADCRFAIEPTPPHPFNNCRFYNILGRLSPPGQEQTTGVYLVPAGTGWQPLTIIK